MKTPASTNYSSALIYCCTQEMHEFIINRSVSHVTGMASFCTMHVITSLHSGKIYENTLKIWRSHNVYALMTPQRVR
jgi:hypothetical protein